MNQKRKSVTDVLNHKCYRYPGCALRPSNPEPRTGNPEPVSFPLSVLFGFIWCSLVLFGPKIILFGSSGISGTCHFQRPYLSPTCHFKTSLSANVYRPPVTLSLPHTPVVPPFADIVLDSCPNQSEVFRSVMNQEPLGRVIDRS